MMLGYWLTVTSGKSISRSHISRARRRRRRRRARRDRLRWWLASIQPASQTHHYRAEPLFQTKFPDSQSRFPPNYVVSDPSNRTVTRELRAAHFLPSPHSAPSSKNLLPSPATTANCPHRSLNKRSNPDHIPFSNSEGNYFIPYYFPSRLQRKKDSFKIHDAEVNQRK